MDITDELISEYLTILMYGLPAILLMGKVFFGSWGGFFECVRYSLMPDLVSLLRGQWGDDQWATVKLLVFVALCAGAACSAHRYFYA